MQLAKAAIHLAAGCTSDTRLNTWVSGFTNSYRFPSLTVLVTNQTWPKVTAYTPSNNNT